MFDGICDALHRELEQFDEKFSGGAQMNAQELDTINKMTHALKSLATYDAMRGNSEDSYARGRSRMTGRYISRDGYSRDDGYRRY